MWLETERSCLSRRKANDFPIDEMGQPAPDSPQERQRREDKVKTLLGQADDEAIGRGYDQKLVQRLLEFIRPYRLRVLAAVLWMVATTLLAVSGPWIIGQAVDEGLRTAATWAALRTWTLLFAAAVGGMVLQPPAHHDHGLCRHARRHRHAQPALSPPAQPVAQLPQQRQRGPPDEPADRRRGRLQDFVTWTITGSARAVSYLIGMSVAMLLLNWVLALVAFAVLPLMILLTTYWRSHVREAYRATRSRLSLINGYLNESIQGIRVTQSFHRERRNIGHFDDLNRSFFDANTAAAAGCRPLFFPASIFSARLPAPWCWAWAAGWCWATPSPPARSSPFCSTSTASLTPSASWRSATTPSR